MAAPDPPLGVVALAQPLLGAVAGIEEQLGVVQATQAGHGATLAAVQATQAEHGATLAAVQATQGQHTAMFAEAHETQAQHTAMLVELAAAVGGLAQAMGLAGAAGIRQRLARSANSTGVGGPLVPVPDDAGIIPDAWPVGFDVHALMFGDVPQVDALLHAYGIHDADGLPHPERRVRLAEHLGVRLT